ncbi:MAG TPA: arginine--tRNA ligase [Candidatus Paceibacterota bacterium]
MEETIRTLVADALKDSFGLEGIAIVVEEPKDLAHGDYATSVALSVSKTLEKNPREIANTLAALLNEKKGNDIAEVTVAGPGFINFTLAPVYFAKTLETILEKQNEWGSNELHKGKKILVEHSSPNLFKPFHIGHVMNNTIGQSLVELARASGAAVTTTSFPSDISLGVAKAIFILLEKGNAEISIDMLGQAYVEGTKRYDEDETTHMRIKEIADHLYAQTPSDEYEFFQACKALNIAYFESILSRLGSDFDSYIYESEAGVEGKKIVLKNTPGVFTESEGAVVYVPAEDRKDINTAVFINSQGNPTYEAKDIGLLSMKFNRYAPDLSLFVTDNQQVPHFAVVLDAAKHINDEWASKSIHIHHGRMSFKGEKMSSRLGGVPVAQEMMDAVGEEAAVRAKDKDIVQADAIAIAAIKFSILRAAAGKDINFDPETSLSFEGDSGPYLQYSTVRAQSILAKGGVGTPVLPENWTTTTLEKQLIHFPEVVAHAIEEWSPHFLVTYLLELSQSFNSWYGNTKVIDDTAESPYKLALTAAFAQTMKNGLKLLALPLPSKM